ncbi:MAG: DNA repair protein RadC [Deltaproteobacteria bacterium]|nr:DNA repair protein RadC [Deltaproteobacteria bacterium]
MGKVSGKNERGKGHFRRLKEKYIEKGGDALTDEEMLELLLILGTPRADCKQQAREALKRFKTLRGVFDAPTQILQQIPGVGPKNSFGIRLVKDVAKRYLKQKALDTVFIHSPKDIFEYLYLSLRGKAQELFLVIFLDTKNRIKEIEELFQGTLNASAVYPREIIKRAIELNSASLVFVHNHPSGSVEPSIEDKIVTRNLVFAAKTISIDVLDHIIIGENRYFSFADHGYIQRYKNEFDRILKEI